MQLTTLIQPIAPTNPLTEQVQQLTLSQARVSESLQLYVLNMSDQVDLNGGRVTLSLTRKDGDPVLLDIPRTWLPIDLAAYAPRAEVLSSTKFMQAINKGLLAIVSDEVAEGILSDPSAAEERARLQQAGEAARASIASRGMGRTNLQFGDSEPPPAQNQRAVPQRAPHLSRTPMHNVAPAGAAPKATKIDLASHFNTLQQMADPVPDDFRNFVGQLNEMSLKEATTALTSSYPSITEESLKYLKDNVTHTTIQNWATSVLSQM